MLIPVSETETVLMGQWQAACLSHMQEASSRPTFEGIKLSLTEIASTAFNCAASDASHLSRVKSQALLGQMLPAKASLSFFVM